MGKLDQKEMSALRWLLGQLMVLVSLAGSYTLDLGADALITTGIALTAFACLAPSFFERIPGLFWRLSPIVLLIVIISDFILSGGDFLPPLFRMVLLLTLYRALQVRTQREDLQLLILTLFLLVVTGVLSQEITFGLQLLVYAPLAMGLLFIVNLTFREPGTERPVETGRIFAGFSWWRLLKRAWKRFDRRTLLAGFFLFIVTTGMALLLFVLLPRFDIGAALPFPRLQTSESLTGFTDHVQYGDVVSILNDDTIAMRVDVEATNPPARPYWRMVALDAYYDGGFMVSPSVARQHRDQRDYLFLFQETSFRAAEPSTWTLYMEGGVSAYLPAADSFKSLRFQNRTRLQFHDLTRVFKTAETNATTLSLRYENVQFGGVLPFGPEDGTLRRLTPVMVNSQDPDYLKEVKYPQTLLAVPGGPGNAAILEEVLSTMNFTPGMAVGEFSQKLEHHLQDGRGYSLDSEIPPGEADSLLRWVNSGIAGHCELYAGAFVLISRYAGYPARLVTGFAGGDWNGFENYFMVRNRHAHAWCEIFDPQRGWIRVDPTPGSGAGVGTVDTALAGGSLFFDRTWRAYLDSLRILWFRRVIQFDSEDQTLMADTVKGLGLTSLDWLKDLAQSMKSRLKFDLDLALKGGSWEGLLKDIRWPFITGVLIVLLIALLRLRSRRRGFESHLRRRAGRLLKQSRIRELPVGHPALEAVLLIRYGSMKAWPTSPGRFLSEHSRQRNLQP